MTPRVALVAALGAALLLAPRTSRPDNTSMTAWRDVDPETRAFALRLARRAFEAYADRREVIDPPRRLPELLRRRAAVFVSGMRRGAPRCCMGSLLPTEADAAREIIAAACAAAGRDRRFPPVDLAEARGLTLIVSVVVARRVLQARDVDSLDPVREGVAVHCAGRVGVTLSGETVVARTAVRWARIRAGAGPSEPVGMTRLEVVRFVEDARRTQGRGSSRPRSDTHARATRRL